MAKKITSVDVFQFKGPKDLLLCLEDMVDRCSKEPDCKPLAALTAVLAWSIAEWVHKSDGPRLGYDKLNDFQDCIRKCEPAFGLLQGLGNAFKHAGKVNHPTRIVGASEEKYVADGYVKDGYFQNWLSIEDDAGARIDCADALGRALNFWKTFFS